MKKLYQTLYKNIDVPWMVAQTEQLWRKEFGQCFRHYREAAEYTEGLLTESNLADVERIPFPADGQTVYQDKTSPLAWDATVGRLTVQQAPIPFNEPIVADYQRHPFHLIKGSVATPPEGVLARLVTEEQASGDQNLAGAMVLFDAETRPRGEILAKIIDRGALGFVSDFLSGGRYLTPDALAWFNALTEGPNWHVVAGDRSFIGFSISPRTGDALRRAARRGEVLVHVLSDGRRHVGEIDFVTATLPGRDKREVWVLAHLYEPLTDDNSSGVIAAVAAARAIRRLVQDGVLPAPRFTLRLTFGLEMYGFAAFAERQGGNLRESVLGGIVSDGLLNQQSAGVVYLAPPAVPFFGDYLLEDLVETVRDEESLALTVNESGAYWDDQSLNDSTTGLATAWIIEKYVLHHNSAQTSSTLNSHLLRIHAALHAAWLSRLLTLEGQDLDCAIHRASLRAQRHAHQEADGLLRRFIESDATDQARLGEELTFAMAQRYTREERRLKDFHRIYTGDLVEQSLPTLRQTCAALREDLAKRFRALAKPLPVTGKTVDSQRIFAATVIPARVTRGFPCGLARVPKAERQPLPDGVIYGPLGRLLANMDGRKTLADLLREVEWETGTFFSAEQIQNYMDAIAFLTKYGYLNTHYK